MLDSEFGTLGSCTNVSYNFQAEMITKRINEKKKTSQTTDASDTD